MCKFALAEGVGVILCGDFQQFSAVSDGMLENSDMIRDLTGTKRLTLTDN